jgi:diguanylate cyclase (GGDEF)-like protein
MDTPRDWLSHQLSEFLAAVSAFPDEAAALEGGVERMAESVEAEVAAVVVDGRVAAAIGFRPGQVPCAQLAAIHLGTSTVDVPGIGTAAALAVDMEDDEREAKVVLLRADLPFTREETVVIRGMARVLALTLRLLRLLERERAALQVARSQAEENAWLLTSLQERQQLLERLFRIQRSISHRAPIDVVLAAITDGASTLLDAEVTALRLLDEDDPTYLRMASCVGVDNATMESIARTKVGEGVGGRAVAEGRLVIADDYSVSDEAMSPFVVRGLQTAMAAPVFRDGKVAGSLLVASYDEGRRYSATEQEMLLAFAEHTSLALNDSSAVDAINRAYADAVHRATHDELTGLPNRALVLDRLQHAIARSGRDNSEVSVLFVDLDRFKSINDSLGHSVGDEVLSAVAYRLQEAVRPSDTVGRLAGDEFVVVCEDTETEGAMRIAERVAAAIAEPISLYGRDLVITPSVGLATAAPSARAEDVLRDADVAMYRAKERGRARIEVFDETIRAQMLARIEMEHALRRAIANGELRLHYQPVVETTTGKLVALEALVRWQHPTQGLLYPDTFIPLAESAGLIIPLGRWVIEESCRQIAEWRAAQSPLGGVRTSINLSARQFADAGLVDLVRDAMSAFRLSGASVGFEITESVLMEEAEVAVETLGRLKRLGVYLAIDDFGTGYSSLSYLQLFPVDTVKIDRSFVMRLGSDKGSDVIIAAVVGLAQALGLDVVAEGVETADQLESLVRLGCRRVQGYYFGRPQAPEAYESDSSGMTKPRCSNAMRNPSQSGVAASAARSSIS